MHILRWVTFILVLCCATSLLAHSPTMSTTIISQQKDGRWILQVKSSMTAYESEVENKYGPSSYATPEEFQSQVLDHVKDNIIIQYNQIDTSSLINGIVRLGHETNVIFELTGAPTEIETITIYNTCFKNISRSQSAVIIFKEGLPQKQFILNKDNKHQVSLRLGSSTIEQISEIGSSNVGTQKYKYVLFAFLILSIGVLLFRLKKKYLIR